MQLWTPSREDPELLAWWGPLLLVGRAARTDRVPWPVHIDQFDLLGRVDRAGSREPVWVYRHRESGGDIYADPTGQTYRYHPTPKAAGAGRFDRCDVRTSIYQAGLPDVVEPIWYETPDPRSPAWSDDPDGTEDVNETHELARRSPAERHDGRYRHRSHVPRRNRWLHVVPTIPA